MRVERTFSDFKYLNVRFKAAKAEVLLESEALLFIASLRSPCTMTDSKTKGNFISLLRM